MINNSQNNKFSNRYQQSPQSNKWAAPKKQQAKVNQEVSSESDGMKGCLVHLCGFLGICFLVSGIVSEGMRVPVLIIPFIKIILFLVGGNQTLCCIVGAVLLLFYGACYLLYKDKYFKNDKE